MHPLLLNVELSVKCGNAESTFFKTDTGVPQGDCASANEFTFYLARALENDDESEILASHQSEHNYSMQNQLIHLDINQEYADDMSEITSNPNKIIYQKETLPAKLKNRNLVINADKTEEYKISGKNCDDLWKKCKFLGTMLDTQCDIKRRIGLAIDALKKLKYIFSNKKISIITKTRTLNAYISPIFLYNCETWTLTANNEKSIDTFHRRLLRTNVLDVRWPKTLSTEAVYQKTKVQPWSVLIRKRRLRPLV